MTDETITPLLAWMRSATPEQRDRVAAMADTTRNYLYQLASANGVRGTKISAALAFRLEDAMAEIAKETNGALPALTARDLAALRD